MNFYIENINKKTNKMFGQRKKLNTDTNIPNLVRRSTSIHTHKTNETITPIMYKLICQLPNVRNFPIRMLTILEPMPQSQLLYYNKQTKPHKLDNNFGSHPRDEQWHTAIKTHKMQTRLPPPMTSYTGEMPIDRSLKDN